MTGIEPAGVATVNRNVPVLASQDVQPGPHRDHLAGHERLGRQEAPALPVGVRRQPPGVPAAARAGDDDLFSRLIGTPRKAICV